MRKQGDGYVIRSEESMTLMTPYRFPHYDALPSAVILNGVKKALRERWETG